MKIQCWFYPDNNKFIEGSHTASLAYSWDIHLEHHNGGYPCLEEHMKKTIGDKIEWLDEIIDELCTIPKKLFKQLKVRDVIKSRCFIAKDETKLAKELTEFVNYLEFSYIVRARTFNHKGSVSIHFGVVHEDYEYDFMYVPKV